MALAADTHRTDPAGVVPKARGLGSIRVDGSPLARKIVALNLVAILVLVVGMLALNPFRDSLVRHRETGLVAQAELVADVFEAALPPGARLGSGEAAAGIIASLDLRGPSEVFVFDASGRLLATSREMARRDEGEILGLTPPPRRTLMSDLVDRSLDAASRLVPARPLAEDETRRVADRLVAASLEGGTRVETDLVKDGDAVFAAATPIRHGGRVVGAIALTSGAGEVDALLRAQIARVLELVAVAVMISVGLSLALAATIASPLSRLARAAETGQTRDAAGVRAGRVRIPDLSARRDEIGRLSESLRGMVAALYRRIDANEQFAADVAHEIKNPLASLRSAVGALRRVEAPERRARLLDVIDHDVRRLDRLVSDISNASRLDSELVKEEAAEFDLAVTLDALVEHLGAETRANGVEIIADLPEGPLAVTGLESRLAQVFVNLIGNAASFCGPGGEIRVRARRREDRIVVSVEDTGPGIPEAALARIFERFYSDRPERQFGDNSGLGLAISKQIVEAHGGTIWAENIRPVDGGATADPIGARFVVCLPA